MLGLLNSCVTQSILDAINPTINFGVSDILKVPFIFNVQYCDKISTLVKRAIELAMESWDSYELSWNFRKSPLIIETNSIENAYKQWDIVCDRKYKELMTIEIGLNKLFCEIYGLNGELDMSVDENSINITLAEVGKNVRDLISYAVGCMFGRYSLDVDGLAYAGGEWDNSKYTTFLPDQDNVIPITDEEYLEDDIVGLFCAWLKKVYGADTLEENLDFIASALGNKGNSSREVIRNYFLNDFFKDHCQTYSVSGSGKRPIYWLFDSGKQNGFKALIYLHRYTPDTIGNLRIDYLHRMQRIYESEMNRMQDMIDNSTNTREVGAATKRKEKLAKQLKECREYDEKIGHLALSRIELDLDDGVKVNYEKVQTASDGKKYQVLAKI
jgi:hypothetical protein